MRCSSAIEIIKQQHRGVVALGDIEIDFGRGFATGMMDAGGRGG
jgi:hypothetical protein